MKRLAVFLAIFLCLAVPATATESFRLNILQGEDFTRATGEVRIVLGLNAAPTGAQLVLDNTTTMNLGQTITFNGDSVRFEAGPGNSVRIIYQPLSNFTTPGNFCTSSLSINHPIEVLMRFVGAQDVVDYRMASYVPGAPAVECSKPFKRVVDFPAFIAPEADDVGPAMTAVNKGRIAFDLVLVLDRSGSMSELPPGATSGPSKADILKSALATFVVQWRELDAPQIGEDGMPTGVESSGDRIGVVFFDTSAAAQTTMGGEPPANFFVPRTNAPSGASHPWTNVINTINTLSPGGTTALGAGINEGMRLWTEDPDNDLAVVVVTDGKQNVAPLIEENANGFLTLAPVAGLNAELRRRFTQIQSIGFGTPSGVDQQLLEKIALQTNGRSFVAVNAATVFDVFGQTLVQILKGNTVSTILRRNATMTGAGPSAPHPLIVGGGVSRVVVSLQWEPPLSDVLDLEVFGPGGAPLTPTTVSRLPQAAILRFDIRPDQAGDWSVRVKRAQSHTGQSIPYTLTGFVTEDKLEYRLDFGDLEIATGQPIRMRVQTAYGGKPLNKLPEGAIRVRVQRPAEGLGTILHNAPGGDGNTGNTTTPRGDVQTPYDRKVASVTTPDVLQRLLPRDVETLTLREEKPGTYTATFADTTVPGTYAFEVLLDWTDPRTGHVRREERIETQVKVGPVAVPIEVRSAPDGSTAVTVTPRDRFGNYLGPGFANRIKATLRGAGSITDVPVDRDQTGTYVFTVTDLPPGQTPDVTVTVDGVNVGNTTSPAPPSGAAGSWRVFFGAGPNFPLGALSRRGDGQSSINVGVERLLSNAWWLELSLGRHLFDGFAPAMWQLTAGGKRWFGSGPLRPFAGLAAGAYHLSPTSDTRVGGNANIGVLYELSPRVGAEGTYSYHVVNTSGDSYSFTALQVGVRFSF